MTHKIKPLEWVEVEKGRAWVARTSPIHGYGIEQPIDIEDGYQNPWMTYGDGRLLSTATDVIQRKKIRLKEAKQKCEQHWAELAPKIIESILEQ